VYYYCIIVYKVLYVNGLRLSSHSIKRRCDDDVSNRSSV